MNDKQLTVSSGPQETGDIHGLGTLRLWILRYFIGPFYCNHFDNEHFKLQDNFYKLNVLIESVPERQEADRRTTFSKWGRSNKAK